MKQVDDSSFPVKIQGAGLDSFEMQVKYLFSGPVMKRFTVWILPRVSVPIANHVLYLDRFIDFGTLKMP